MRLSMRVYDTDMSKTKLIIFDWDDVFTHGSTAGYYACYHEAVKGVGVKLTDKQEKERIAVKWGSPHPEEIKELLKENLELVDRAVEIYEDHFFGSTFVNELSVLDGSVELLERLGEKHTLALATGMHPKLLREVVIPKFGIPDVFAEVVTAYDLDDPSHAKPHPMSVKIILERTGYGANEAVMVGDAKNDVGMARAAGIRPIVVLSGHLDREQAEELDVRDIIGTVLDVEAAL